MQTTLTKQQLETERLHLDQVINDFENDAVLVAEELKKIDSLLHSELSDKDREDFTHLRDQLAEQQREKQDHQSDLNLLQNRVKELNQSLASIRRKERLSDWDSTIPKK